MLLESKIFFINLNTKSNSSTSDPQQPQQLAYFKQQRKLRGCEAVEAEFTSLTVTASKP